MTPEMKENIIPLSDLIISIKKVIECNNFF